MTDTTVRELSRLRIVLRLSSILGSETDSNDAETGDDDVDTGGDEATVVKGSIEACRRMEDGCVVSGTYDTQLRCSSNCEISATRSGSLT